MPSIQDLCYTNWSRADARAKYDRTVNDPVKYDTSSSLEAGEVMDRHSFLRGQLWLRPLTDGELHGATDGQGSSQGRQQRGSSGQQQTVQLLPPPLTRSDADGNTSTTVSSWCCFNVGPRFCIFCPGERGEDQTQFELKLTLKIPIDDASDSASAAPTLFARFDGKEAYALNLAQIIEVKMPNTRPLPESHALANGSEPPPYGCLDFGNASLRVWMDPQQVSHSCARDALQQALEQIQLYARQARQVSSRLEKTAATSEPSWRSIYRYNQLLQDERSDRIAVLPSDFEKRARELLSNGDDFEAVKMVISKIDQGKRSKKRRRMRLSQSDHDHDQESVANRNDEEPYSNLEVIMLVTELCHVLGEDHEGLNQLLELSDSNGCCKSHDRCFSFSASPSAVDTGDCIVSRWNAWDGFIELSQLVLKSKRINSHRFVYWGVLMLEMKKC